MPILGGYIVKRSAITFDEQTLFCPTAGFSFPSANDFVAVSAILVGEVELNTHTCRIGLNEGGRIPMNSAFKVLCVLFLGQFCPVPVLAVEAQPNSFEQRRFSNPILAAKQNNWSVWLGA